MHDLVHDLARSVMADEYNLEGLNCRYVRLTDCSKSLKSSINSPAKIRALHFAEKVSNSEAFSPAKNVRVLDFSMNYDFTGSICELKQLRYLSFSSGYPVQINPMCIGMLSKLNYLRISSNGLRVLPESISEMKDLMHLDLSDCRYLEKLPLSFGKIRELVHLDLSGCRHVLGIPKALGGLTKLQHLGLSACEDLRGLPDAIANLTELRYLNLSKCSAYIFDHSGDQTESFIDRICTLPNMKHLDLSDNNYPFIIPESASYLDKLVLEGCRQIIRLPRCVDNIHDLGFFDARLREFSVYAGDTSSNIYLLKHTRPARLEISQLENVRSPEEAQSINLSEKQTILGLTLVWTDGANRSVDDMELLTELVPPTTLKRFAINGYCSVGFPDWLMSISSYLPNLVILVMKGMPNCKSMPPLSQLPNLQELTLVSMESLEEWNTSYLSGKDRVNDLKEVHIFDCPKLRIRPHLPRAASWFIMKSDNVLVPQRESVSHIDWLTAGGTAVSLGQWGFLHHQLSLRHLNIYDCSNLTISSRISGVLTNLQSLRLDNCSKLPEWLGKLTSLSKLKLFYCHDIMTLPDSIQELKNLKELRIVDYNHELKRWCNTEENKTKLAHIGEIFFCEW